MEAKKAAAYDAAEFLDTDEDIAGAVAVMAVGVLYLFTYIRKL